ncbi:MAG: rRNA pseudouridine synthase [Acidobacteriota bacterium]|nr:rRNA pseudouridine synthase [Acidobacteriota bacterium]
MTQERLQKLLARAGKASRRAAEDLIRQGRVTVNGKLATIGDKADPSVDAVKLDGRRIQLEAPQLYFLLNKPTGVMTTKSDPEGRPTVFDLIPPRLRSTLIAVGRLDFDTEGLLVLTDDGEFAHRVAHPRYGCAKTYEIKVKGRPPQQVIERLRRGVVIAGRRTLPARITPIKRRLGGRESASNSWWQMELREGRTRQIREMFLRAGYPVQRLRRVAIGGVRDPRLPKGAFRELTPSEIERLGKTSPVTPKAQRG